MDFSNSDFDIIEGKQIGSAFRKARKAHKCECGNTIHKGERYERQFWIVDGDKQTVKLSTDHMHSFEDRDWDDD